MAKKMILWKSFYEGYTYHDQHLSMSLIERLVDMDHDEVMEVIDDVTSEDESLAQALLMHAIEEGVPFTSKDFIELYDCFYDESYLYEGLKRLSKTFTKEDYQALGNVFDLDKIKDYIPASTSSMDEDFSQVERIIDGLDEVLAYLMQALEDLKQVVSGGIFDAMQSNLILSSGKYAFQASAQANIEYAKAILEDLEVDIKELQAIYKIKGSFSILVALTDIMQGSIVLKNCTIYQAAKTGKQLLKVVKKLEKARNAFVVEDHKKR